MFHRNCFQTLLLNFRSSTETVSQEDPQIDFAKETFFALGGRGVHKNVSKILATTNFNLHVEKILVSMEEFYRNHKFKPNKSLDIPDC